ncbi:MAG: hypothetical protein AAFN81_02260 [Bacteroidota bacterium]
MGTRKSDLLPNICSGVVELVNLVELVELVAPAALVGWIEFMKKRMQEGDSSRHSPLKHQFTLGVFGVLSNQHSKA